MKYLLNEWKAMEADSQTRTQGSMIQYYWFMGTIEQENHRIENCSYRWDQRLSGGGDICVGLWRAGRSLSGEEVRYHHSKRKQHLSRLMESEKKCVIPRKEQWCILGDSWVLGMKILEWHAEELRFHSHAISDKILSIYYMLVLRATYMTSFDICSIPLG